MTSDAGVLEDLLAIRHRDLDRQIREALAMSKPCPPGHWRWGDLETSGYRRKPEAVLVADRDRYRRKLPRLLVEHNRVQRLRCEIRKEGK